MSIKQNKTNGKWQFRYRDLQGVQRAKSFTHKKDAMEFAAEVKLALRDGTWVSPSEKKATVGRLWADFIALKASKKLKTRIDYESIWRTHLEQTWSEVPARKVSQVEFTKWVITLGCSPQRVDKIHLLMTMILDVGVEDGILPRNVLLSKRGRRAKGNLPHIPESEVGEALTLEQLIRLAIACAPYTELVLFLGLTGARFGEAAGLKVSSVDFENAEVKIRETLSEVGGSFHTDTPKNHKRREVVAPQYLLNALIPLCAGKDGDDYVFTTPSGTPVRNANFAKRYFKPALKRLGLPDIRIHDLRYTAAAITRSSGGDVFDMKEQVGHSDIRTTINIYGRIFKEDKVQIAQNLNTKLENVHKMCTEAENNVKFAEIVSQNPLQIQASKAVDSDDAQVRPTDYESAALTS
jgi:integrase